MKRTEKKRKDIIDAAIDEFREQGFLGAKTTSIAKRASVSSRTLYNHFESKEALFDAISEIMLERNSSMAPVPYDPDRDFAEQLKEALWQYVEMILNQANEFLRTNTSALNPVDYHTPKAKNVLLNSTTEEPYSTIMLPRSYGSTIKCPWQWVKPSSPSMPLNALPRHTVLT